MAFHRRIVGILRHNGWELTFLLFLFSKCYCLPDGDLCRWMNGRKYYIDVGESGIITAENITSQSRIVSGSSDHPQIPQRCSVELVTCSSCHFKIFATQINIPTCSADNTCRCDFVWIKESANAKSGQEFCGHLDNGNSSSLLFESQTKQVSVDFLYSGSYTNAFVLHFSATKNVYVFKGGFSKVNASGTFTSPNFPSGYPSDYSSEYILQNADTAGFVQLLFTDFQLSLWSYMEILDSNGSRIDAYNGNTFRPPAIMSSGPTLTLKFHANEEYSSSGFTASYTFVGYTEKYWINRPSTDCGGVVDDFGGAITMMNMVPGTMMKAYDCIWLIRPRSGSFQEKQLSVRVAQFEEMGPKSTLMLRQGLYSVSPLLESVVPYQQHEMHRGQEYVVPASTGFYIRLVGYFKNKSHLAIVYSTFQYEGCYAMVDFECGSGRCIKNTLRCDGFNHCGDGTDESTCYGANQGTQTPEDVNWWRALTPNYYFPKSDAGSNAGTNTLILVTSLAGLGMFVLTTVVILVKLHKQRQDDGISREILQTISADIEAENAVQTHHRGSDPPVYDPPPSYDDVIKFYMPPPPSYSRSGSNQIPTNNVGRTRRSKAQKKMPMVHNVHPSVLQVILPDESNAIHGASLDPPSYSSVMASPVHQHSQIQNSSPTLPKTPATELARSISSELLNESQTKAGSNRKTRQLVTRISCECKGACSCSINYSNDVLWPNGTDVSSRHSPTTRPSDAKKPRTVDNDANVCVPYYQTCHRRSSSDPSEITFESSRHGTTNCDMMEDKRDRKQPRPSSSFRHEDDSPQDNRNEVPSGWSHLCNPPRRRHDVIHDGTINPLSENVSGQPNDTQPLLWQHPSRNRLGNVVIVQRQSPL